MFFRRPGRFRLGQGGKICSFLQRFHKFSFGHVEFLPFFTNFVVNLMLVGLYICRSDVFFFTGVLLWAYMISQ